MLNRYFGDVLNQIANSWETWLLYNPNSNQEGTYLARQDNVFKTSFSKPPNVNSEYVHKT